MTTSAQTLAQRYATALRNYLDGAGEAALHRAYELGRQAMTEDFDLLDLVSLHHRALERALKGERLDKKARLFEGAQTFLSQSLSPFEMTQREFREAVTTLRRLNQMLEDEAGRIARSLHDDAAQILVSVYLALDEAARDLPPPARSRLKEVRDLLDEVEKQLRRLSHELRPPILDDLGLLPALEFLAQGVAARSGVSIDVNGRRDRRFPPAVEIAIYRVVQEALTNAIRHARPGRVTVSVRRSPGLARCEVRDDGAGFDPGAGLGRAAHGLGLRGMRERLSAMGGQLIIDSAPKRGTKVSISIPLDGNDGDTSSPRR